MIKALIIVGMVLMTFFVGIVFALLLGWLAMLLWNWLMPVIFNLPKVGYWQMVGFMILLRLLIPTSSGSHKHD